MDGWMDAWVDEWMDGCMGGWMDAWMDAWVDGCMDGWAVFLAGEQLVAKSLMLPSSVTAVRLRCHSRVCGCFPAASLLQIPR